MKLKTLVLAGSAAVIMTACATATPYQPAAAPGKSGFSQSKVQSDRYTVSFAGNTLTDRETVETYLLYRAAEVAVENGYSYFTMDDKDTEEKTRLVSTGSGFGRQYHSGFACRYDFYHPRAGWGYGFSPYSRGRFHNSRFRNSGFRGGRLGGFGYDPFWDDFNYREITKYKAHADIRLHYGDREGAFNAGEVIENLGPKLVYPEVKDS